MASGIASKRPRVLVTGASGYLGRRAALALAEDGVSVVRGARLPHSVEGEAWVAYGDLGGNCDLEAVVAGCDAVVHFAGLAHVPPGRDSATKARAVNAFGTERLAVAAARAGVKRFVYISSAQVHGAASPKGPLRETDEPRPADVYAASKLEAEHLLREVCDTHGLSAVILRPPMVYGPSSPGNFGRLVRIIAIGLPLPLAQANAPKSFIGVDNLCSAVARATLDARAANQTFLVSDNETLSTAQLATRIAALLGRTPRMMPVPERTMRLLGRIARRSRGIERLFDPFVIDTAHIRRTLNWAPPVSLDEGLLRAVGREPITP